MDFHESKNGEVHIFELAGKLMGDSACNVILSRVDELIASGIHNVVLEVSKVQWMNSQAIAQVIACLTKLRRAGGDLRLAGVSGKVDYYLRLTKLNTVIRIFKNQQEATDSFIIDPPEQALPQSRADRLMSAVS
jgi:anti-anti-sigma factor